MASRLAPFSVTLSDLHPLQTFLNATVRITMRQMTTGTAADAWSVCESWISFSLIGFLTEVKPNERQLLMYVLHSLIESHWNT